mgnify:FL=1
MSVYKTMMRRRAFTNWANNVLRSLDKQIVDIFNPNECALLEALLQVVLAKSEKKFKDSSQGRKKSERETLLSRSKEFKKNYFKSEQGQDVNRHSVIQFIWDLIEFFHISPGKELWESKNAKMNAKEILLKWLNGKLGGRNVKNFTTDWNDGTLLCDLFNSLEPGLIPAQLYLQGSWPQRNVKTAMEAAEKNWSVPMIISPDDMVCSEVDELSVMTYIALVFEYDQQRNSTNQDTQSSNGHVEDHSTESATKQNGSTENILCPLNIKENITSKPEVGKVGKEIEYRLDLHDVNANEITVSVEFKPSGNLTQDYKPDLKVFSMGKGRFRVKYTPNLAGNYRLSMYYKDEHIADSPYCVSVLPNLPGENGRIDLNNNKNRKNKLREHFFTNGDNNKSGELLTKNGFYGFDGEGLKHATVGKLAVFTVITDNRDKGPLSVCINCPAVSLPVPHVNTTCSKDYSTHTVAYMPTLAGNYTIYVRWGLKLINGSPFEVSVGDHDPALPRVTQTLDNRTKRRSTQFSHIKVYYSSSSLDPDVIRETEQLDTLLQRYGITRNSSDDIWVSIDLELQKDERDLIFRLAGTRRLPLVFIHEQCLGNFDEVCKLENMNELEERLMYKIRKV